MKHKEVLQIPMAALCVKVTVSPSPAQPVGLKFCIWEMMMEADIKQRLSRLNDQVHPTKKKLVPAWGATKLKKP